ncbi:MAG: sigma-70 family RNA polymerase sigma factor [Pirellulaceae bacterium]
MNHELSNQSNEAELMQLIALARGGDRDALGVLIDRYRNYLLLIANEEMDATLQGKLGASDVVQQSMLQAQQKFTQFRGASEQEWQGWLRKILQNGVRKAQRSYATGKRNRKIEISLQQESAIRRGLMDANLTPASDAINREKSARVHEALNRLSNDHRVVIRLRSFDLLEFEEIGSRMDRSAEACRKLWGRAISALRKSLEETAPEMLTGSIPPTHETRPKT